MEKITEKTQEPSIVFRIDTSLFAISSAGVMAIREIPTVVTIPDAAEGVRGVFMYRNHAVSMFDLRTVLGKKTLDSEYRDFVGMLEQRKQDHYHWMAELNRSVKEQEPFGLATDPHQCAFGKWYYGFHSENNAIQHHLRKIEEPHRLLHLAGVEAASCKQQHETCTRKKCLKDILHEAEHVYAKKVIDLIEETKIVMKDSYREMALVILHGGTYYGFSVDEVLSVEELEENTNGGGLPTIAESVFVKGIKKSKGNDNEMIIELDEEQLLIHFGL